MKKYISRFVALLVLGTILTTTISSCSVEYRESHRHYDHDHDHDDHDHDHYYHNY